VSRTVVTFETYSVPSFQNPNDALATIPRVPKVKFEHIKYVDCENETFVGPYNLAMDQTAVCEGEHFSGEFEDLFYVNGLTYQWQKFKNGAWEDFANADKTVDQGTLTQTGDIRPRAYCAASSTEILTEVEQIKVNSAPPLIVNFQDIAYCIGNPAEIIASGADTYS